MNKYLLLENSQNHFNKTSTTLLKHFTITNAFKTLNKSPGIL